MNRSITIERCQARWRRQWLIALALALWTFALRVPLISNPLDVSPDGAEYFGIARHLVDEGRWVSSLKWHYFTDEPVVHPALADRPPLFPLWVALWMGDGRLEARLQRVRLANVALAAAAVVMAFRFLARSFPPLAAAGAALLFASYPAFVRNSAQPLTEPLFLLLLLGSLHTALARRPVLAGILGGLAYLTRPTALLLLPVLLCSRRSTHDPPPATRDPRPHLWLLAGFGSACLPYWVAVWWQYGNPFYSILSYNFSIGHIHEGMFSGFERHFPTPSEFVRENPGRVARLIGEQTQNLGLTLLRSLRYLWPLALFLRWEDFRRHREVLAFTALNFAFHAVSWTVWGAARYQFPGYLFLSALLLEAPIRRLAAVRRVWLGPAVAATALGLSLAACLAGNVRLFHEKRSPQAGVRLGWAVDQAAAWLNAQPSPRSGVCAANYPAILNLLTQRPAIVLPRFHDTAQVRRFLDRYQPVALILMVDEPAEAAVADVLLERPWRSRRVRPELKPLLEVAVVQSRPRTAVTGPSVERRGAPIRQWLFILRAPESSQRRAGGIIRYSTTSGLAGRYPEARDGISTLAPLSVEHRPVPRHAAATAHLRGTVPADDRRVPGKRTAVRRGAHQVGPRSRGAG